MRKISASEVHCSLEILHSVQDGTLHAILNKAKNLSRMREMKKRVNIESEINSEIPRFTRNDLFPFKIDN